jgi:hypothetical protein
VFDPPPGGNNNRILDPGESATLELIARNTGGGNGYNVRGILKSGDGRLTVTDSIGIYGTVVHDSIGRNSSDRFGVTALSGIQPGTSVSCTVRFHADPGLSWARPFTIRVGLPAAPGTVLADHDTGYCRLTVSAFGALGYDEPAKDLGSGFKYPKTANSGLYYGGMVAGNSEGYIVDHYYGVPASEIQTDWVVEESLRFYPPLRGDEMLRGSYTDAGHSSPQGLRCTQTSYMNASPGYDDFVVLVYDLENTGSSAMNGMYSGIFCDFDIGSMSTNVCRTISDRRVTFMRQASTANPCLGIKLLYPPVAANLSAIDHDVFVYADSAMTDGMKLRFLDGTYSFPSSNRSYDWSAMVSAGPFDIPAGMQQRVAFALVGAIDSLSFLANCDSAQNWFDQNVSGIFETPRPGPTPRLALQLAPNPFSGATRVSYSSPYAGNLRIRVFDAAGREQATLVDRQMAAGTGTVTWNANGVARGVYFVRASIDDLTVTEKALIVR